MVLYLKISIKIIFNKIALEKNQARKGTAGSKMEEGVTK